MPYYTEFLRQAATIGPQYGRNERPVVLFHLPHVGSTTLAESLKRHHPSIRLFRSIKYSDPEIKRRYQEGRTNGGFSWSGPSTPQLLAKIQYLRALYDREDARWRVITLVRDPVSRAMSAAFARAWTQEKDRLLQANDQSEREQIISTMIDSVEEFIFDVPSQWFDTELKSVFGIDVFSSPFEHEDAVNGYKIYNSPHVDLLVLRLENLDRCYPQAFQEFMGLNDFTLVRANEGVNKDYQESYRSLVGEMKFPPAFLDKMYSMKYVRHFYKPEEIDAARARWEDKQVSVT